MMRATVLLQPMGLRREIFGMLSEENIATVADAYRAGQYITRHPVKLAIENVPSLQEVAEECFDLTNHPGRQEERELVYGRHASVSVGDIIEVEDPTDPEKIEAFACASFGWIKIEEVAA